MVDTADFVVIGAGVVGITIALELKRRQPGARVVLLEKEPEPGRHSSGRNSGVLHSGIYYPPGSLKARVCGQGAAEMRDYCRERGLPLNPIGKILLPLRPDQAGQLDLLEERGRANGVETHRLDAAALAKEEPDARSATGEALLVPITSVVSSAAVFSSLVADARAAGVEIRCGEALGSVDAAGGTLRWGASTLSFGHAVNTAGLHADSVAHKFGVGLRYTLLPFKGLYWKLAPDAPIRVNHLVYPVPDLRVPFLGVHTTTAIDGTVYLGPTAVPAWGRENYRGRAGVTGSELLRIGGHLLRQFMKGQDGFRRLTVQEGPRYFKPWFAKAAQALLPRLRPEHLLPSDKVGIRAQMLDRETGKLVNDFLVEGGPRSTHVLNAISPAFTSAFPFARHVCDHHIFGSKA